MLQKQLVGNLGAINMQAVQLAPALGGSGGVVVTPHGARVMGLFTNPAGDNLYFTNSELESPAAAKAMFAGEHFLGGDRLWLAPERGLNFKGNVEADGYSNQRAIDPGNWVIGGRTERSIRLVNEIEALYFHRPGSVVRGLAERTIRTIPSPFYHTPGIAGMKDVHFAGYEIASRFSLLEAPSDDLYIGLWFLIQVVVPHGGYVFAPTLGQTVITDYYEPTGADYLRVTENHVRFKLDSKNRHKIGIRKTEATGRAAFLSNAGPNGSATLVVRNFLVNPSAHYSDVPLHTPGGTQDVVQSYNHHSGPSGFGELEFHTPGINRAMAAEGGGEPVVMDTNQVWAFTGPRENLVAIAVKLLGLPGEVFRV